MTTTTVTTTPTAPTTVAAPGARRIPMVGNHIPLRQVVANSLTLGYRGLLKMKHDPEMLIDVTLQPVLFTVMFTYLFGGAISGGVHAYLPTIVPGVLVQTVLFGSITTGVKLREDMDNGVFDRFRSLPIARIAPLAGALLADLLRYAIAITMTVVMGLIIGYRPDGGVAGVLGAALMVAFCAFSLSWIFALLGVAARNAAAVQGMSMLVLLPLTFGSSAFVPVDTLPGWLQAFVKVNPVTHLIYANRELMNNGHVGADVGWSLLGGVAVMAVFAPLAVRTYMRKA
jgi:ABC-2 type transport system permease protein